MLEIQGREVEEISIVTAVYNHEATVADTLDSILMQNTSRLIHIYCMDDASTDRSGEILAKYQACHPDKISIYTSLKNQGSGKKSFLHHRPPVNGKYWCLLAGDDYWITADKLEKQVVLLEQSPNAVGCSTHTRVLNEQTGEESIIQPELQRFNLMDFLLARYSLYVHPSGLLWKNAHLKSGFFLPPAFISNDVSGDTALLHMMVAEGGEIVNLPEAASCYRMTGKGVWTRLSKEERNSANRKIQKTLRSLLPIKYRISRKIFRSRKLRKLIRFLPELFPRPINALVSSSTSQGFTRGN